MDIQEVTSDHTYVYINGEKFFPIIQEKGIDSALSDSANGVLLTIDCHQEEVDWDGIYLQAQEAVESGKVLIFEFFFTGNPIFLEDSAFFFSLGILIEEFTNRIYDPFKSKILGVVLYRGTLHFERHFIWTEVHEQHYLEKKAEYPSLQEDWMRGLFAADVFVEYLHRVGAFLPAALFSICLIDLSGWESTAALAFMLSSDRFQHMLLALKRAKAPLGHLNWEEGGCVGGWIGRGSPYFASVPKISIAVCLPHLEVVCSSVLEILDGVFSKLNRVNIPFRIIEEDKLNECWDGVDDLIVLPAYVSTQGKRKLQGFLAAGGRIVSVGDALEGFSKLMLEDLIGNLAEAEVLF